MPRRERKKSSTGIYHITQRGINKQRIFEEPEDFEKYLSCLAEVKKISGFKLYAYCLMDNHVHLLIKEGLEPLAQVFKRLGVRYVFWYNKKYQRSGHLYQDRFRSVPIETDEYFITVLAYIYQNPVKAGICANPEDYNWSSLKRPELINNKALNKIIPAKALADITKNVQNINLEPEIGKGRGISDNRVLSFLSESEGITGADELKTVNREIQAKVLKELKNMGASVRQLARISGLNRERVMTICREV